MIVLEAYAPTARMARLVPLLYIEQESPVKDVSAGPVDEDAASSRGQRS